jgi:hypothetical protein
MEKAPNSSFSECACTPPGPIGKQKRDEHQLRSSDVGALEAVGKVSHGRNAEI